MSKLVFDHSKRVLDLGAHAGFELFDLLGCSVYRVVLVQRSALARAYGDVSPDVLPGVRALVRPLVASIPMG